MGIIAWRLFWLTHINRQLPDASCTTILADHEWKALYTAIHRRAILPPTPPTVRQAVRWIAQLGGGFTILPACDALATILLRLALRYVMFYLVQAAFILLMIIVVGVGVAVIVIRQR